MSDKILNSIVETLTQKKGFNILALDVRDVSTMTDFFVIAEGNVDRHVIALAKSVMEELKEKRGIFPVHIEGLSTGDWIVLDYLNVVVHLFMPGLREKYQLEQVWHDGKVVDIEVEVNQG